MTNTIIWITYAQAKKELPRCNPNRVARRFNAQIAVDLLMTELGPEKAAEFASYCFGAGRDEVFVQLHMAYREGFKYSPNMLPCEKAAAIAKEAE